jgi:two-component system phosphate regulon response regulator PhoB
MAKVLIAEDEEDLRELIRITLDGGGFHILQAADGVEAIEIALAERPELVLLDWQMPGCTGPEVCVALRGDPRTASTRIIMITSRAQNRDRLVSFQSGADDYLTKPFSPLHLLDKVRAVLGPEALL